jgi:hypothetical protein
MVRPCNSSKKLICHPEWSQSGIEGSHNAGLYLFLYITWGFGESSTRLRLAQNDMYFPLKTLNSSHSTQGSFS